MAIEHPHSHSGINYKQIAEAYKYKPFPDHYVPVQKIDLGITWNTNAQTRMAEQAKNLKLACDNPTLQDPTKPFDMQFLHSIYGDLPLESYVWIHPKHKDLCINVTLSKETRGKASSYMASKKGNSWEIHDRIVGEAYREQGIGTQMTKTIRKLYTGICG